MPYSAQHYVYCSITTSQVSSPAWNTERPQANWRGRAMTLEALSSLLTKHLLRIISFHIWTNFIGWRGIWSFIFHIHCWFLLIPVSLVSTCLWLKEKLSLKKFSFFHLMALLTQMHIFTPYNEKTNFLYFLHINSLLQEILKCQRV